MNAVNNFMKLSPGRKAQLIAGCAFFLVYFALGLVFLFVNNLPFVMSPTMKTAFGIVLIAYSGLRLSRITGKLRDAGNGDMPPTQETEEEK